MQACKLAGDLAHVRSERVDGSRSQCSSLFIIYRPVTVSTFWENLMKILQNFKDVMTNGRMDGWFEFYGILSTHIAAIHQTNKCGKLLASAEFFVKHYALLFDISLIKLTYDFCRCDSFNSSNDIQYSRCVYTLTVGAKADCRSVNKHSPIVAATVWNNQFKRRGVYTVYLLQYARLDCL